MSNQKVGGERGIDRRNILKTIGAGAAGSSLFIGTASAAAAPEEIRFCGCSQVCVKGDKPFDIYIAWEEDGVWECTRPKSDNLGLTAPKFCFELTDETRADLGVPDDAKIVGIESGPDIYCNPNQCAQKAQEALNNQDQTLENGGTTCAQQQFVCEPEDSVDVYTKRCNTKAL